MRDDEQIIAGRSDGKTIQQIADELGRDFDWTKARVSFLKSRGKAVQRAVKDRVHKLCKVKTCNQPVKRDRFCHYHSGEFNQPPQWEGV